MTPHGGKEPAALVSAEALAEFKTIWREENGYELTDAQATAEAVALLTLFRAIYRPIKKEWLEEYRAREQ